MDSVEEIVTTAADDIRNGCSLEKILTIAVLAGQTQVLTEMLEAPEDERNTRLANKSLEVAFTGLILITPGFMED
ncbi:hypothetical protein ABZX73_06415 [Brevibacterium casei]